MLSRSVQSYPDSERYESAFVGARAEVVPTRSGSFSARSVRVVCFFRDSSFDGRAMVRIGHHEDAVALRWRYDRFLSTETGEETGLPLGSWTRLQAQLDAARFWTLPPQNDRIGLDGARWLIEGRRGDVRHQVRRWSPDGEVHALGQPFFELAGPPLSKLRLY